MTRSTSTPFRPAVWSRRSASSYVQPLRRHVGRGGLATTQVIAPRFGRMLTWTLAGAGVNDFLQAGFTALTRKANELELNAGH